MESPLAWLHARRARCCSFRRPQFRYMGYFCLLHSLWRAAKESSRSLLTLRHSPGASRELRAPTKSGTAVVMLWAQSSDAVHWRGFHLSALEYSREKLTAMTPTRRLRIARPWSAP